MATVTATQYETAEYEVWARNVPALEARIAKLNRRAAKLGVPAITLQTLETREIADEDGLTVRVKYLVRLTGAAPKIAGWTFVATLDHTEAGTIVRTVPGLSADGEFASYRNARAYCDHCRTSRRRINTYLVRDEAGTVKQVGSNCLADFLGHANPHQYAAMAEIWIEAVGAANEDEGADFFGRGGSTMLSLTGYVGVVAAVVRIDGWLSRGKARELADTGARATADKALDAITHECKGGKYGRCKQEHYTVTPEDEARAAAALEWARGLGERVDSLSDYEYNLYVTCRLNALEWHQLGLAASVIAAHDRALGRERERKARAEANAASVYVGTEGVREVFTVPVDSLKEIDGLYGLTTLYRMRDEAGNVLVWFASGSGGLEVDTTYTVKATVKKHEDYNGVKQTVLTRVALDKPKAPRKRKTA